jgi:hypothetical protein
VVVDEVAEEVDVIGILADVGVAAVMTITADAVEEAVDMEVEEEEDMEAVGTVVDVMIMAVAVAEVEEAMAVSRIYHCYVIQLLL